MFQFLFALGFLILSFGTTAQTGRWAEFTQGKTKVRYFIRGEANQPLIPVLAPCATTAEAEQWAEKLSPLAAQLNAEPAVALTGPSSSPQMLTEWVESFRTADHPHVLLIGAETLAPLAASAAKKGDHLVVLNPMGPIVSLNEWVVTTALIQETDSAQRTFSEAAKSANHWTQAGIDSATYAFNIEAYTTADSILRIFRDSASLAKFQSTPLLTNPIPPAISNGRPLTLNLFISRGGSYEVRLLDVGSKTMDRHQAQWGLGPKTVGFEIGKLPWGVYSIEVKGPSVLERYSIIIRG